jgi:hypothetical protein
VAGPRALLSYMRMVSPGSPVDAPWPVPQQILNQLRLGKRHAPRDSPLTLADVMAREDYRDLMTAKVAEGDLAPDFDLPLLGGGRARLAELRTEGPVALVFGSYT